MWVRPEKWYDWAMSHETATLDERGRVMIPARTRRRLGLSPGDRMLIEEERGGLRLLPLSARIQALRGAWADVAPGRSLVDELIADRRAEARRE